MVLVPVVAAAVVLWRREPRTRGLVVTLALMLTVSIATVACTVGPVVDYRLRYTWVLPSLAAVVLFGAGWSIVTHDRPAVRRVVGPVALVATLLLAAVNIVLAAGTDLPHRTDSEIVGHLAGAAQEAAEDAGGPVLVTEAPAAEGTWYSRGIVLALERAGVPVGVPTDDAMYFTGSRTLRGEPALRLHVASGEQVGDLVDVDGLTLLARWTAVPPDRLRRSHALERRLFTAWLEGRRPRRAGTADQPDPGPRRRRPAGTSSDVAVFIDRRRE